MKIWLSIFLAAAAAARAAEPADSVSAHAQWDRLLIQPPAPAGAARHWQHLVWPWEEMIGGSDSGSSLLATLAAGDEAAPRSIDAAVAQKAAWRAARPDGVLVRPDLPLAPTEQSILPGAVAGHEPMVAWSCSDQAGQRTAYVFCYDRMDHPAQATFTPKESGFSGRVMVLNRATGEAWREPAEEPYLIELEPTGFAYYEVAPVRANGLVFFGDSGKFVSNGRQRISQLINIEDGVAVTVDFALGEKEVTLFGFASVIPKARAKRGQVGPVGFAGANGRYTVLVTAPDAGSGVRQAEVEILGGPVPPPRPPRPAHPGHR